MCLCLCVWTRFSPAGSEILFPPTLFKELELHSVIILIRNISLLLFLLFVHVAVIGRLLGESEPVLPPSEGLAYWSLWVCGDRSRMHPAFGQCQLGWAFLLAYMQTGADLLTSHVQVMQVELLSLVFLNATH